MALVSATLTINFPANYVGCHRVCYRQNNSGGYTCVNTNCAGGGATCSVPILITVDNETCPTVEFDGYAQACCEDVSSLTGRIPFSVTFVPSPACKRYIATCNNVALASLTVTNQGSGYTVPSNPSVSFSGGGGGSGATGTANVGTGFITTTGITFTTNGTYNVDGTYAGVNILGGSGTGAVGTFTVAGNTVTLGTITSHGNGYLSTDVLHPDAAAMGGNTVNATFSVATDYGKVISITLNTAGSGYTVAPGVTVAPPPSGTTALATAVLGTCSNFAVTSCTGAQGQPSAGILQPGQTVDFCTAGTPPAPTDYTIAQDTGNCLCNCQSVTLSSSGGGDAGNVHFRYTACNGAITTVILFSTGSPSSVTVCAVSGSVIKAEFAGATGTITYHGAC